jgi:signal transduction histidine kinase/ActR/RegA family two-component response regulator
MGIVRISGFVFCLLWCSITLAYNESIIQEKDKKQPLKIATLKENPPFSFVLPDGSMSGYYIEFWRLWSEVNQIPIEFIPSSLLESLDAIKYRQVDFHTGLFINDERKKYGDFSLPIHRLSTGVFFAVGTDSRLLLRQLDNKKIAVQLGSFQESYLRQNYSNLNIITFENVPDTFNKLLSNEIDAIVGEIPHFDAELGKMGLRGVFSLSDEKLLTNDVHAFVPKNRPEIIDKINAGIQKIPVSQLIEMEQKWLPIGSNFYKNIANIDMPSLTLSEQQWLLENQNLILGVDPDWSPFEFIDADKKYSGIVSEYVDIIQEKLSIKMSPSHQKLWTDALELSKFGKIDVLTAIVKSKERERFLNFTEPYLFFPAVIATRKEGVFVQSIDDLSSQKVAVVKGYAVKDLLIEKHPEISLYDVASVTEGLRLLAKGDVDAFIDNLAVITHEINNNNLNNLKVAAFTPYKLELSMGVRKGLEPLVPILNKVLATISNKQKATISNNWLALKVNVGTELKTIVIVGVPVVAVFLIIILFVIRANRRMMFEIAARKKIEQSLEKARLIAESANNAKDEFLANMSHEIRTPMNAVVGMAHLLEATGLNKEQQEYIDALNSSATSLLLLIDGILDLSKIESGKLELEVEPFRLREVIKSAILQAEFAINKNKIKLVQNIAIDIPNVLMGDSLRLGQILLNLINNAIKFTDKGLISLSICMIDKKPNELTLHFSIEDTGIGLTKKQQSRLFQTYSQADSSTTRKYGGTGLGLVICKKLCEKMKGEIWVESEFNKGSTFHFTASFNTQEKIVYGKAKSSVESIGSKNENLNNQSSNPNANNESSFLRGKDILVVDDNNINLVIAKKILKNTGVNVKTASNGKEAIELINKEKFDAVLMDIQMPVMDGYTATRQLRKDPNFERLPIIAMSANMMPKDVKNALKSGMNAHVGKPIKIESMLSILIEEISANI